MVLLPAFAAFADISSTEAAAILRLLQRHPEGQESRSYKILRLTRQYLGVVPAYVTGVSRGLTLQTRDYLGKQCFLPRSLFYSVFAYPE